MSPSVVHFPNGEVWAATKGLRNEIAKAVVERFTPRFLLEPAVVRFAFGPAERDLWNDYLVSSIGIKTCRNLPAIILADVQIEAPKVIFVEVVATDGAITQQRKDALLRIALDAGCTREHIYFVTAFRDRTSPAFRKLVAEIAWGTFVWFASEEEKLLAVREGGTAELPGLLHA